jgi:hypothetical protein
MKRRNGGQHWFGLGYYDKSNQPEWADTDSVKYLKELWDGAPESWRNGKPFYEENTLDLKISTVSFMANLKKNNDANMVIIWVITGFSTISLLLGLNYGIQMLGNFTFLCGLFLMWAILMMDDTWYILNLFVQSVGHYIQWIIQMGFYSGAFDMPEHGAPDKFGEHKNWLGSWTIFYWGWWIAWAPLVGTFIGRISKGRTIREYFGAVVFGATTFNIIWMVIYGGAGLKMEMAAMKYGDGGKGLTCSNPTENVCRIVDYDRYTNEPHYLCSLLTKLSCLSATNMMPSLFEQYSGIAIFMAILAMFSCFMYFVASSDSGSLVDSMLASNGLPEPSRIQRFYWSITEGAAASSLLYAGRFTPQDDDAQLRALQAVSIVIGLPWTLLICLECVSLWRACEYEYGDRKWGGGFKTSIVDFGITAFRPGASTGGVVLNCGAGKIDCTKLIDVVMNIICPPRAIYQIMYMVRDKAKLALSDPWIFIVSAASFFAYYLWILLICLDHISTADCPYWESGSKMGDTDTTKKYSTRYGIFHGWGVDIGPGATIATKADGGSWMGLGLQVRCGGPENNYYYENMTVGKRIGSTMRIAVFGWFFLFCFVAIVAYIRATVRTACKKHGNAVEDALCSLVAWPTVLSQIKDTLNEPEPKIEEPPPAPEPEPPKPDPVPEPVPMTMNDI